MKAKPDPKAVQRATAQVIADHRPRQLGHEPRLSRRDEQDIADAARLRNGHATRGELLAAVATMSEQLAYIKRQIAQVAPGIDHRDTLRLADRAINRLTQVVNSSTM